MLPVSKHDNTWGNFAKFKRYICTEIKLEIEMCYFWCPGILRHMMRLTCDDKMKPEKKLHILRSYEAMRRINTKEGNISTSQQFCHMIHLTTWKSFLLNLFFHFIIVVIYNLCYYYYKIFMLHAQFLFDNYKRCKCVIFVMYIFLQFSIPQPAIINTRAIIYIK